MKRVRWRCFWAVACLVMLGMVPSLAAGDAGKHLFILSGQSNMRGGLPVSFKRVVSGVYGADNVIMVVRAQPSQPIRRWYKNWSPPEGQEPDNHAPRRMALFAARE